MRRSHQSRAEGRTRSTIWTCCVTAAVCPYLDLDDTVRRTYGHAKQGTGRGYTGFKGLNALVAVLSTPTAAPVIAASRLRRGSTNSARGAPRLLAEALATSCWW